MRIRATLEKETYSTRCSSHPTRLVVSLRAPLGASVPSDTQQGLIVVLDPGVLDKTLERNMYASVQRVVERLHVDSDWFCLIYGGKGKAVTALDAHLVDEHTSERAAMLLGGIVSTTNADMSELLAAASVGAQKMGDAKTRVIVLTSAQTITSNTLELLKTLTHTCVSFISVGTNVDHLGLAKAAEITGGGYGSISESAHINAVLGAEIGTWRDVSVEDIHVTITPKPSLAAIANTHPLGGQEDSEASGEQKAIHIHVPQLTSGGGKDFVYDVELFTPNRVHARAVGLFNVELAYVRTGEKITKTFGVKAHFGTSDSAPDVEASGIIELALLRKAITQAGELMKLGHDQAAATMLSRDAWKTPTANMVATHLSSSTGSSDYRLNHASAQALLSATYTGTTLSPVVGAISSLVGVNLSDSQKVETFQLNQPGSRTGYKSAQDMGAVSIADSLAKTYPDLEEGEQA